MLVAFSVCATACGGGEDDGKPDSAVCEPSSADLLADALAFERALIIRGRADAGFEQALGDQGEALLDQADEQQTELIEEVAADLGLQLPPPASVAECSATLGIAREPLSASVQFAFAVTALTLVEAAKSAPISGATESKPYTKTTTDKAADGSTRTIVTTFNTQTSGHDSVVTVTTTLSSDLTTGSGSTRESAYVAGAIDVCPDPGGISRGNVSVVLDGTTGSDGTYHAESNQNFNFIVNDQANVASTEVSSTFEYQATGGAREADVAAHADTSFEGESNSFSGGNVVVDHSDGSAESQALVTQNIVTYGLGTAGLVREAARRKWRGGTCVEVVADPASELVDKGARLEITATPRHKIDGSNVDASVVATLSGVESLDKEGQRAPAPASYHYVAGSKFKDQGVITFKSTSRRGIGQGTSTITVRCDEEMECPEGKQLNPETCLCECAEKTDCPSGQVWDEETCECVCAPEPCSGGERWDNQRCECVCDRDCPAGTALNELTCQCEPTCEIDPLLGNSSPDCRWVGTITMTMSEDGSVTSSPQPEVERTVKWSLGYDASMQVEDQGTNAPMRLTGAINGSWERKETETSPMCGHTLTESASATGSPGADAYAFVSAIGGGKLGLSIELGASAGFVGTTTWKNEGDAGCSDDFVDELTIQVGGFQGSGTASADSFTGSGDVDQAYFSLPNERYAVSHVSWNLRLVKMP
jgi:hypothetical protein